MLSTSSESLSFAEKFASKLALALESAIAIGSFPVVLRRPGLDIVSIVSSEESQAQSLQAELAKTEFSSDQLIDGIAEITIEPNPTVLVIDASERQDASLALFAIKPNLPSGLLRTLITSVHSQLAAEQKVSRDVASPAAPPQEEYAESFIEQVTQDFEELTWFRQSHQFADLYTVNASSVEVAHTCVAPMAKVIQAESLLFLEVLGINSQNTLEPSRLHLLAGPEVDFSAWQLHQLTQNLVAQGRTSPVLLDRSRDKLLLDRFQFIENCMLTVVAKGERVFGWLIAINKYSQSDKPSQPKPSLEDWNRLRFGTFEAGLLTTAANMLASQASNCELFSAQEALTKGLVLAVINAIDAKDCYTAGHSERVASFAQCIAKRMGLSAKECDRIHMAGLLHDVGKIGIPDSVLKKPDKLTDEEFEIIKLHPFIGYSILRHLSSIDYVLPGVLLHHEAFDGSGYPQGLQGHDIPLMARILAVCDAFDAMTSTRPYRKALPLEKAAFILRTDSYKTWDGDIVEVLFECIRNGLITPGKVAWANMLDREPISDPNDIPDLISCPLKTPALGTPPLRFPIDVSNCLGSSI
ncbi:MAG: HD-GYP domain-containing protein [Planctomycetes bacterium]|nr:HD-GYP domain-containing protein [Planctomycetota bacterium]